MKSKEYQARLRALRESIRRKYATQLAGGNFASRFILRWRMVLEYRRERRRLLPSPESFFVTSAPSGDHEKEP